MFIFSLIVKYKFFHLTAMQRLFFLDGAKEIFPSTGCWSGLNTVLRVDIFLIVLKKSFHSLAAIRLKHGTEGACRTSANEKISVRAALRAGLLHLKEKINIIQKTSEFHSSMIYGLSGI